MEPQTYKIYVNGVPVFLTTPGRAAKAGWEAGKHRFNAPYMGQKKVLLQYLDLLDKNRQVRGVVLHHPEVERLWNDFKSCFQWMEAAGGYVENMRGELLVMFRRGSWDLPKGKIDPGETPDESALREVREETGLREVALGPFLGHTLHTYPLKGRRILKKTWWYRMRTTETDTRPQTEEDIEEIRWVQPLEWLESGPNVYESIREVVEWGSGDFSRRNL
jgi:8-oxo-dGTP pyrophosphatase MutT (NUDIX family)